MTQLKILNYAQAAAMDKWWLYDDAGAASSLAKRLARWRGIWQMKS